MYETGRGVNTDLSEAVRLYQLAADAGHGGACNRLGLCHQQALGVAKVKQNDV